MRTPLALLILLAGLLAAPAALAQDDHPPPDSSQGPRVEADSILQVENATDLFDNVTDGEVPQVRHRASGLICTFTSASPQNHILIYASGPRGDDVSCGTEEQGFSITTYATRHDGATSVQALVDDAVEAIRGRFPDARPYEGEGVSLSMTPSEGGRAPPERLTARLQIDVGGRPSLTRVSIAIVDGWVIKQRLTGPLDQASLGDLTAELFMTTALLAVQDYEGGSGQEGRTPVSPPPSDKPPADI